VCLSSLRTMPSTSDGTTPDARSGPDQLFADESQPSICKPLNERPDRQKPAHGCRDAGQALQPVQSVHPCKIEARFPSNLDGGRARRSILFHDAPQPRVSAGRRFPGSVSLRETRSPHISQRFPELPPGSHRRHDPVWTGFAREQAARILSGSASCRPTGWLQRDPQGVLVRRGAAALRSGSP